MYLTIFRQTNVQKTEEITIVGCLGALILTVATNMISSPAVIPKPMFWDKRMAFAAEWGIKKYSGSKPIKTLVSKKHISYKNKFQWWVGYIFFIQNIFLIKQRGGSKWSSSPLEGIKQKSFQTELCRPAGMSDWKVLFLFLLSACPCSFVLLLRVFASSESRSPPLPRVH